MTDLHVLEHLEYITVAMCVKGYASYRVPFVGDLLAVTTAAKAPQSMR